mmetsp:Transcript_10552/g.17446  ORF Transcript_10552/g.17446 Transcript_10552/m.17446 type:complete len:277 (+) Transcript_10552:52-882(+)
MKKTLHSWHIYGQYCIRQDTPHSISPISDISDTAGVSISISRSLNTVHIGLRSIRRHIDTWRRRRTIRWNRLQFPNTHTLRPHSNDDLILERWTITYHHGCDRIRIDHNRHIGCQSCHPRMTDKRRFEFRARFPRMHVIFGRRVESQMKFEFFATHHGTGRRCFLHTDIHHVERAAIDHVAESLVDNMTTFLRVRVRSIPVGITFRHFFQMTNGIQYFGFRIDLLQGSFDQLFLFFGWQLFQMVLRREFWFFTRQHTTRFVGNGHNAGPVLDEDGS